MLNAKILLVAGILNFVAVLATDGTTQFLLGIVAACCLFGYWVQSQADYESDWAESQAVFQTMQETPEPFAEGEE
jgi:hypothetical protein